MNDYALQGLVQIVFVGLAVLIPITGVTLRFMLRPLLDANARKREYTDIKQENAMLEKRVAFLEHQIEAVDHRLTRLDEAQDFTMQLGSGTETARHRS